MSFYAARILVFLAVSACLAAQEPAARARVLRIDLQNEAITPVTERFITTAIRKAGEQDVTGVVLVLDTPGGLVDSTRGIVKAILQSPVPVVVYLAPTGARAASAGTFITMAALVAAMAPGTTIGLTGKTLRLEPEPKWARAFSIAPVHGLVHVSAKHTVP